MIRRSLLDPCPECQAIVLYGPGRRACKGCGRWCHAECSVDSTPDRSLKNAYCRPCVRREPKVPLSRLARCLNAGQLFPALEVVLWSLMFNQDEAEISEKLCLPLPEVQAMGERLRAQGIWADGHLYVDDPGEDDESFSVCLVLAALCAEGRVRREPVGSPAPAVPGEGGTNDGNQEDQDRDR